MASNCAIALLLFVSLNALVCCNADSFILSENVFIAGSSLRYNDYVFTMQRDCNLVLYDCGNPIWATNTNGKASQCYCYLGKDGNLAIKTLVDAKDIWSSNTPGKNDSYVLVLQEDRNVVIYGPSVWTSGTNAALAMSTTDEFMNINQTESIALLKKSDTDNADNVLLSGWELSSGSSLRIANYVLIMHYDCNLVLYDSGKPIWATNTRGLASNCYCYLQNDGNLLINSPERNIWSSNMQRDTGDYVLVLQRDGKLVIYGPVIWDTATKLGSRGVFITNVRKIKETNTSIASA